MKCKQCENPMLKGVHTCSKRRPKEPAPQRYDVDYQYGYGDEVYVESTPSASGDWVKWEDVKHLF